MSQSIYSYFYFYFFTFFFHLSCCVFFVRWLLSGDKKAIPESGWVFDVARQQPVYNQISPKHLRGPFPRKMIKFNPYQYLVVSLNHLLLALQNPLDFRVKTYLVVALNHLRLASQKHFGKCLRVTLNQLQKASNKPQLKDIKYEKVKPRKSLS